VIHGKGLNMEAVHMDPLSTGKLMEKEEIGVLLGYPREVRPEKTVENVRLQTAEGLHGSMDPHRFLNPWQDVVQKKRESANMIDVGMR